MLTRIVVADQAEARFYDAIGFAHPLRFVGALSNPHRAPARPGPHQ
jgi:hypothetical protein